MPIDNLTSQTQSLPVMDIKPDPDAEKPRILKQAITSINGKPNLLKLLNNYKGSSNKNEVFKTIGNRIVIPMKVSVSTKKLAEIESGGSTKTIQYQPSTFQMALSPKQHQNAPSHTIAKISSLSAIQNHNERKKFFPSSATVFSKVILKGTADLKSSFNSYNGDLRPFVTSVPLDSFPRSWNDDQESTMSSTDSYKLNTSMNSSKMSDFDEQFDEDDDLTCLSWLSSNNKDLIDTIRRCNPDDPGIGMSGDEIENEENHPTNKSIFLASSLINRQNAAPSQITNDVTYNPMNKPPYSFSCLIFMAIEDSYLKRLPVKDIYTWVCRHFPYFETAPSGWKNSIRHNLSLNRCFKKAECRKDSAKGSLWCIDPAYRPNLVQALKRSPFYPYLHPTGVVQPLSLNNLANLLPGTRTGRVPSWSPSLRLPTLWDDPDMASAALNLMGLRRNENIPPKNSESISNTLEEILRDAKWMADPDNKFSQNEDSNEMVGTEPVVICGSQQDHLYTCPPPAKKKAKREDTRCRSPESDKSAPDAAYEFETAGFSGDELESGIMRGVADEVVVDESDAEAQSLFDSGFGSMKKFDVKKEKKKCKVEKSRPRSSSRIKKPKNPVKKVTKSKVTSAKPQTQPSLKKTWKSRRRIKVRINSRHSVKRNKDPKQREKKNSDVDSGKDSPKVDRYSRSRRLKQRSYRKENTSDYHTRSSCHKLLGQDNEDKKRLMSNRRRKRLVSNRNETTDEEEEIKRAAGSLLRLFQSSICSSKVATD